MECKHEVENQRWSYKEDYDGEMEGYWEWYTESFLQDIDTGRMQCTRCKAIKYYTGLWREHWEGK